MKLNNFCLVAIFTMILYSVVLFFYYDKTQENSIEYAKEATEDFFRTQKATKKFFNEAIRPIVQKQYEKKGYLSKFFPELYSCTYASKEINNYYNKLRVKDGLPKIEVSFLSYNPKNPKNRASKKEEDLIKKFNKKKISSYYEVFEKNGKKYLYYIKPTAPLKKMCMRCHGNPKDAPKALIKKYGKINGFNHKLGEIRAVTKIVVPIDKYIRDSQKLFWIICISTFSILIFIFVLTRIFVVKKQKESKKLQKLINILDEIIILKSNKKIYKVNEAFLKFFNIKNSKNIPQNLNLALVKSKEFLDINFNRPLSVIKEQIQNTPKEKRLIQIKDNYGKIHTLSIKIDNLEENSELFVIVLSDITSLQSKAEKFRKRANYDALTNAFTRRRFHELYQFEFARSMRYISPFCVLFIDIDDFKGVNDTYGHDIGDSVLRDFAKLIMDNVREFDKLGRWGGEEFVLMLPQTTVNDGYKLAEKLRKIIESHLFEGVGFVTCSIGISMIKKGDNPEDLIKRADIGLYKAKNSGKNRTIIEA